MDERGARRISRGRQLILVGAAVVVLVLVGIAGVTVLRNDPGGGPLPADVAAPGVSVPPAEPGAVATPIGPDTPYLEVPPGTNPPQETPTAARAAPGPGAAGAGGCGSPQDPALRVLVDQALPEVAGAPEAATRSECRPAGERGVAVEAGGGLLTVTYLPHRPFGRLEDGARSAPTASGGTVVVSSRPGRAGDPEPFAERLDAVVAFLAPRL